MHHDIIAAVIAAARQRLVWLAVVGAFTAGCQTSIDADDYDQSCDVDDDCVTVADGDKCILERCGCGGRAINVEEASRFQADLDALVCLDPLNDLGPVCSCLVSFAVCIEGACSTRNDVVADG